jgi:hypothetical protein
MGSLADELQRREAAARAEAGPHRAHRTRGSPAPQPQDGQPAAAGSTAQPPPGAT